MYTSLHSMVHVYDTHECSAQQVLFEWLHTSISSAIVKLVTLVIVVSPLLPITHPLNPHHVIEH